MIEFARRSRHVREPDLTPLVDIVFKLVLFFMLTTTFVVSESMELSLPQKGTTKAAPTNAMRIQITSTGYVTIDGTTVNREAMETTLRDRIGATPDITIAIFTTPGVSVQQLVSVMDMVYLNGGRNVQVDRLEYPANAAGAS